MVPYLLKFIDNLTNIYVRLNRKRLKGRTGEEDCRKSLSTLYHVWYPDLVPEVNLVFLVIVGFPTCVGIMSQWHLFSYGHVFLSMKIKIGT